MTKTKAFKYLISLLLKHHSHLAQTVIMLPFNQGLSLHRVGQLKFKDFASPLGQGWIYNFKYVNKCVCLSVFVGAGVHVYICLSWYQYILFWQFHSIGDIVYKSFGEICLLRWGLPPTIESFLNEGFWEPANKYSPICAQTTHGTCAHFK